MIVPNILSIAGSDSSGGAGAQADIKTINSLNCYAASCITAITIQDSKKVFEVYNIPSKIVLDQVKVVLEDINIDIIKTGMLGTTDIVKSLSLLLKKYLPIRLVIDPVMVSSSGKRLLEERGINYLVKDLLPIAELVTPNIPEAEILSGISINNVDDTKKAAEIIKSYGVKNVLIKGGHQLGNIINDILLSEQGFKIFADSKIESNNTHGTGCTLASAICARLAWKDNMEQAVFFARNYVRSAIINSSGFGCLNHNLL